jgi:hypothetical protein
MLLKLIPKKIKVWLLERLYKDIAAEGRMGDTQLAHINDYEAGLLKSIGGSGTINPATGLVEYGGGKGKSSAPAPQQNTTYSSDLPEYAKPFYEELLKQSGKETYTTDASGNVTGVRTDAPYTGDRLAGFTTDQLNVQSNLRGMTAPSEYGTAISGTETLTGIGAGAAASGLGAAGAYTPGSIASLGMTAPGEFDAAAAATKYMSPYQTNVTDATKQKLEGMQTSLNLVEAMGSINRGTFGGGRQALMQGQADRDLQTQLAKIGYQGQARMHLKMRKLTNSFKETEQQACQLKKLH